MYIGSSSFLKKRYNTHINLLKNKIKESAIKLDRYKDLLPAIEKNKKKVIDSNGNVFNSMLECSRFHNVSIQTVCDILKGRHFKTRKGISFKYYE